MSELLVKEVARENGLNRHQISIVKPGYIIGTAQEGVACVNDFLFGRFIS